MDADKLNVDYVALGDLGQQLANVRGEFDRGQNAIAPLLGTISDPGLRSKLSDFTKNWSDLKGDIVKRLDQAAGFATSAAQAYQDADQSCAADFGVG